MTRYQENLSLNYLFKQSLKIIVPFKFVSLRDPFDREGIEFFLFFHLETTKLRFILLFLRGEFLNPMHSHRENSNLRISLFLALFSFASTRSNALSYGDKREFMLIKLDGSFIYWENLRIEETGRECILAFNKNIFRFLQVKLVYLIPNSLFFFYPFMFIDFQSLLYSFLFDRI